jgi:tetratricopeptide (TPR) repeat protein
MPALPVDTLPELLAPRGYVPAAEPPRLAPAHAGTVDLGSGEAAGGEPGDRLERLLASAAAARARMAYGQAAEICAAGAAAARELRAGDWAARFADEADAIGLLSPPGDDPPSLETVPGTRPWETEPPAAAGGADRGRRRLNSAIGLALGGGHDAALAELAAAEAAMGGDDAFGRVLVVLNRAQVLLERGEVRAAATAAADALRAARREKHDYAAALAGLGVALTHLARGRRNEARARLGEAVRTFARYGDALRQVQCHYLLGEVAYAGEDPIRAGSHYRDALAVARPAGAQEWIELLTLRFEHR